MRYKFITISALNPADGEADLLPDFFPEPWATSYGQDDFGLWQGIYIRDIEVRFRWIPPGEFLMGSPEDELERYDDEGPQHRVRIDRGYWLAETACTQGLWQVVTDQNPSFVKDGLEHPVENVSGNDVKEFLKRINKEYSDLKLRLPSEAEWEYACRAGSQTPFWFGSELTTDVANYDGNHPYADGPKGEYRQKTVPVKTFRPNPWGLYQMHGNVWEWCEDYWHNNYEGAPVNGEAWVASDNEFHVLRGGSWEGIGRNLCSAYRMSSAHLLLYSGGSGFRLARGPELQPVESSHGAEAVQGRLEE